MSQHSSNFNFFSLCPGQEEIKELSQIRFLVQKVTNGEMGKIQARGLECQHSGKSICLASGPPGFNAQQTQVICAPLSLASLK